MCMYGIMTDGHRFLFILCENDSNDIKFRHSSTFVGEMEWKVIFVKVIVAVSNSY